MFYNTKYSGYAVDSDGGRWGYIFEERVYENMRTGQRLSPVQFSLREEEILRLREEIDRPEEVSIAPIAESYGDGDGDGDSGNSKNVLTAKGERPSGAGIEQYSQDNSAYESFNALDRLIAAQSDAGGGVLDLTGRSFAPVGTSGGVSDVTRYKQGIGAGDGVVVQGANIYGGIGITWTKLGTSDTDYVADLPGGLTGGNGSYGQTYDEPFVWLYDSDQLSFPKLQVVPTPPSNMTDHRFTFHKDFIGLGTVNGPDGAVGLTQYLEGDDYDVVATDGAINNTSKVMAGITFKNNDLRNHVNDILGGDHPEGVSILLHADANVMGAGLVTGFTFNNGNNHSQIEFDTSLKYGNSNYLDFAFSGVSTQSLAAGEYSINLETGKIRYRPGDGNPSRSLIATQTKIFSVGSDNNFGLSGCKIEVNHSGDDSTSAMIRCSNKTVGITLTNSTLRYMATGVRTGQVHMADCVTERAINRCYSVSGMSCEGSYFAHSQNKTLILCQWGDHDAGMPVTNIKDCLFHLPASAHGQAVSLYQDSWQKANIEHNIFYDVIRCLSLQHDNTFSPGGDNNNRGGFTFSNNLVYNENCEAWDASTQGQPGLAYIGDDTGLTFTPGQHDTRQSFAFKHNTIWTNSSAEGAARNATRVGAIIGSQVSTTDLIETPTIIESNIVRSVRLPTATEISDNPLGLQHVHRFNKIYGMTHSTDSSGRGHARTDSGLVSSNRYDTFFDEDTMAVTGGLKTLAEDGATCGIRWQSMPTRSQLQTVTLNDTGDNLKKIFVAGFPSATIPDSGLTFGGYSADDRIHSQDYKIPEGITIGRFSAAFSGSGREVNAVTAESGVLQQFRATSLPSSSLFTTTQFRFSAKDATTIYTPNYPAFANTSQNASDWEAAFNGNDHVLRFYYTPNGGTKTLLDVVLPDANLNNQTGYLIVASSGVQGPPGDDQGYPAAAGSMTAGDQFEVSLSDQ